MYLLQCKSRFRAKFDSQSAVSGSNPKSQRKPQLKRPIFAPFLAKATCFLKEGGGFPQISTRILSKVCKYLPNPSQTWAQIQKYSENRFFSLFFFWPPALLLLVLARIRKSRGSGKKDDAKIFKCQTCSVWALGKNWGWLFMYTILFVPSLSLSFQALLPSSYTPPLDNLYIGLERVAVLQTINIWSLSLLLLQGLRPRVEQLLSSLEQQELKSPISLHDHKKLLSYTELHNILQKITHCTELGKDTLAGQLAGRKKKSKQRESLGRENCDLTVQLTSETVSRIKGWNISFKTAKHYEAYMHISQAFEISNTGRFICFDCLFLFLLLLRDFFFSLLFKTGAKWPMRNVL